MVTCLVTKFCWLAMDVRYGIAAELCTVKKGQQKLEDIHTVQIYDAGRTHL